MSNKLERIVSESKSISNNIASKHLSINDGDYKKVLNEFQQMISQMSQSPSSSKKKRQSGSKSDQNSNSNNNNANSKTKRVTFSDHIVDFDQNTSDDDEDNQEMESTTASWSPLLTTTTQLPQTDTKTSNTKNKNKNTDSKDAEQMTQELQKHYANFFKSKLQKNTANSVKNNSTTPTQTENTSQEEPTSTATPKGVRLLGPLTDKALDLIKTEKR